VNVIYKSTNTRHPWNLRLRTKKDCYCVTKSADTVPIRVSHLWLKYEIWQPKKGVFTLHRRHNYCLLQFSFYLPFFHCLSFFLSFLSRLIYWYKKINAIHCIQGKYNATKPVLTTVSHRPIFLNLAYSARYSYFGFKAVTALSYCQKVSNRHWRKSKHR
jgi:hypothetical protein